MAATVDLISGGRLVFGIGAGGAQIPGAPDELMLSCTVSSAGTASRRRRLAEAGDALGEACALVRRMWAEDEPFDFAGRYYQLRARSASQSRCSARTRRS